MKNRLSQFILDSKIIHGDKYDYSKVFYKNRNTKVEILFNGVSYFQTPVKHLMGRCPEKNTPSKTTEQFIEESKIIWGDKYDYSLADYKGALKPIKIILGGVIFEQIATTHLQKRAPEKNITYENFIKKSIQRHGRKYDYSQVKFVDGNTVVMIGYKGMFYLQKPYHHIAGNCPEKRYLSERKSQIKFIKEANLVHDYKFNYDKTVYVRNNIKVIITCQEHGDFEQRPLSHIQGNGCPSCNESKGEKEISKFLKRYNIVFSRQHKFDECKNILQLPFDFFIPSMGTCIEYDGEQHYRPVEHFGGIKNYESLKINDKIKSDYCEENYINLIRIKYHQYDDIFDILWSHLGSSIRRLKLG